MLDGGGGGMELTKSTNKKSGPLPYPKYFKLVDKKFTK